MKLAEYNKLARLALNDPQSFWEEQAKKTLSWFKPWQSVLTGDFNSGNIRWFDGAELNVCYNCVDRHLKNRADQMAIIWQGDQADESQHITYQQLHQRVCRFANVLKEYGITKGDRVGIYLPMIPEAAIAMLACARIGAIHSVVFGGFSAAALANRMNDAQCKLLITADEGARGGKIFPFKHNADEALTECLSVKTVLVIKRTGVDVPWTESRDVDYLAAEKTASTECLCASMAAEDPLFILYTSGSTGKPKGVLHTTAGYLLYAALTHEIVFNYQAGDVYWCAADVGWITGHSYIVYGPLANGAITLMFEGLPTHPTPSRVWEIIDQYQVNIFYTAPTLLRTLMGAGDQYVKATERSSLKCLGTVGEPINPEVWCWYHEVVGNGHCPIVDTWWQTETGGHMITPIAGISKLKPGSAGKPFLGIKAQLIDAQGKMITGEGRGKLVIAKPWPGMMRTVYGDHQRFIDTYLSEHPGFYTTGDGARRDAEGDFWITGRVDDVINVSGHRFGTAEFESVIVAHPSVAEAAVVGFPHPVKGQGVYAFVSLMAGCEGSDAIKADINAHMRSEIGPIAKVDVIQWTPELPKTRSGKIMRRILRKIASNDVDDFGDTSTLADPVVVERLVDNRVT